MPEVQVREVPGSADKRESLELRRNLACLQFVVVIDYIWPTIDENVLRPDSRYINKMHIADEELMFSAHALGEYLQEDLPDDGESRWLLYAQQGFAIVGKHLKLAKRFARGSDFSFKNSPENRFDFHIMLHGIRRDDGTHVRSPFGKEFAEEVATGEINIPRTQAVTVEEVTKIPQDFVLRTQLLQKIS